MSRDAKLINELRDALVDVTYRLETYQQMAIAHLENKLYLRETDRIIARARAAIEKATTT